MNRAKADDDAWAHLIDAEFLNVLYYNLRESHERRTYHYRHVFALLLLALAALFALGMYLLWESSDTPTAAAAKSTVAESARDRLIRQSLANQSRLEQADSWGGGAGGGARRPWTTTALFSAPGHTHMTSGIITR